MLTIAKEKEIRNLVRDTAHASYKTIAQVAGVSASAVSSGLHRALTKLRKEVARDDA